MDVMTVNGKEAHHKCWQEQYNDPCPVGKFGDGEDQSDDGGGDCAQAIDRQLPSPASVIGMHHFLLGKLLVRRAPVFPPVACQSCMGKCKTEKKTHLPQVHK